MRIPGFHDISTIIKRNNLELLKAVRSNTGEPCLIWIPTNADTIIKTGRLLRNDYEITSGLDVPGVIKGKELMEQAGGSALVMEHFGGKPLDFYTEIFPNDINLTLRVARDISKILSELHAKGIVHRAIDDKCIFLLLDPFVKGGSNAGLTYFGLSGMEDTGIPNLQEYLDFISLEYMAPEYTGIVKIKPDNRADLYSMGILLYRMFTGSVPFRSKDSMEMMHWHVAREPRRPGEVNGSIPAVLSDIVMLLLEKEPDGRYDNAFSLFKDLESCLNRIGIDGTIRSFKLKQSFMTWIRFPDKLYGREKEKKEIINTLDSVCSGSSALTFISGYAGLGKTALVKTISGEITRRGGLFAAGKADQYRRDIPYGAFSEALKAMAQQLLLLGDNEIAELKKETTAALHQDMHLLSNIIPELEYIAGRRGKTVEQDTTGAENRFRRSLSEFLRIVAGRKSPFVIFLDDMHWVDVATIKIIKHIIEEDIAGLYIIGAYRDNEVDKNHPLAGIISEAGRSSRAFHFIELKSLDYESIEEFLAAALDDDSNRIKKLALFVFTKTGGNPFYVRQFIQDLLLRGCLRYENDRWNWDERRSRAIPATENILALLAGMMEKLDRDEREVLMTASYIGNRFSREFLEMIVDIKPKRLSNILNRLIKNDYLINEGDDIHAFSHDRIQEAACGLSSKEYKSELHGKIGDMLLRLYGREKEHIFEIADHLNEAGEDANELTELIDLNFKAGIKAKSNFAYEAAIRYFENSENLYKKTGNLDRDLIYRINKNHGECLYLNADYEKAEKVLNEAINLTGDALEKVDLYDILLSMKMIEFKYDEVIDIGIKALKHFGIEIEQDKEKLEKQILLACI